MVGEKRLDFMSFMSVECNQPAKSSVVRVGTKVDVNSLKYRFVDTPAATPYNGGRHHQKYKGCLQNDILRSF